MAEIGIKELKTAASRVIDEVSKGGSYVVTKRGKPAAVIVSIEDAEDLVLAYAEEYVEMRRRGREDYRKGRTRRLADID
jgi:prevent-host-death family protein